MTDEQRRKAADKLEALIAKGMQGETTEMTPQDWIDIRKRGLARIAERKNKEANGAD